MACVLKSVPGGEFEGPTGQKFTIELRADAGKPKILSATYGSTTLKAAPFTFAVLSGRNALVMVVTGVPAGQTVKDVEVCGADEQFLTRFKYDPDFPLDVLVIEGK